MPIAHKISDVPDETCQDCPQNWEGECRAYEMPHSPEEGNQRASGKVNCQPGVSEFYWRLAGWKPRKEGEAI